MRIFLLAVSCLCLLPGQQPNARPKAPVSSAVRPTDAEIQARIQGKLAKSKIGRNGFQFKTSGGVVTIEGKTGVVQHKGAATRLAKSAGARAVVNNIQISEDAKEKARARLAQGRRRAQVTRGEPR